MNELVRYSIINNKDKREIVLLRATKCRWGRCRFCDYHLDSGKDEKQNFELNKKQLDKVTGIYKKLEVVNSGSFLELDKETVNYIKEIFSANRCFTCSALTYTRFLGGFIVVISIA